MNVKTVNVSISFVGFMLLAVLTACSQKGDLHENEISRIAFGSCLHQDKPAPIWKAVLAAEPEAWVWLGDTIYGDSADAEVLSSAYEKVKRNVDYTKLRETAQVFGTWDDHDFGKNNAGKEWHGKVVAQAAMLEFLDEPAGSERQGREGVYASYQFGSGDRLVKLILVDVRSHRDDPEREGGDLWGTAQRAWLEKELSENDAALTIIGSGTQVIPEDHRYEKWAQFPQSRQWFFEQLVKHETGAVLFLSGDRHISEFSKLALAGREQPLYELTSSSLTHSWSNFPGEVNRHRVGEVFHENSFGLLEIDWEKRVAIVTVRDEAGVEQRKLSIAL